MATAADDGFKSSDDPPPEPGGKSGDTTKDESYFECNICLDTARDAVVSFCGHLFCWPCLLQWLETRPDRQMCPVCKAGISKDKVIPLYGRGNSKQEDPREKFPPRPPGQRSDPENGGAFSNVNFVDGGGFHMSFGIGAFPFAFISSTFNVGERGHGRPLGGVMHGSADLMEDVFLSKAFLVVAVLFFFWLLLA